MRGTTRASLLAALCLAAFCAGCSAGADETKAESEKAVPTFDTTRLPRVAGSKEIFANPATTSFTAPGSVADAAEEARKLLADGGWQQYGATIGENFAGPPTRIMTFKRAGQGVSVFVTPAAAYGNATSVNYTATLFAFDLPFPNDATSIEYNADKPHLVCETAQDINAMLDFYRKDLEAKGWSLWSTKDGAKWKPTGTPGVLHSNGAYAYYVRDDHDPVILTLNPKQNGKLKVEIKVVEAGLFAHINKRDQGLLAREAQMAPQAQATPAQAAPAPDAASVKSSPAVAAPEVDKDRVPQSAAAARATPATEEPLRALRVRVGPVPVPASATNIEYDSAEARLEFDTASSVQAVAAFYRDSLKPLGWKERPSVINRSNMVVLDLSRDDKQISFTIMQMGPRVNVSGHGSGLVNTRQGAAGAPAAPAPAKASAEDLEVEESQGLPMPKRHTMSSGEKTAFRTGLTANVPLDLATVLAFYRGELTKRGWTEDAKSAVVKADEASLTFTTPDGPASLKLGRKDGETTVALSHRHPAEAEKAGMMPKAGQAKLLFGNMLGSGAEVTINKQTIRVVAGAGAKNAVGPKLDLPPGKYRYSFKVANKSAQSEEVEVGPNETWGLLIGPGGVLPMHLY